ncbi:MAG: hypothetical protein JNN30_08675 [Rhodanobacteraceae bacterium]|nr:hypothetical protein [Rhodanobacteraceae bacterium]
MRFVWLFLLLMSMPLAAASLTIDGRLDESQWQSAQVFEEFVVVEPFTRAAPSYPTTVRILALPEGIAIGFYNVQPRGVPRQRELTARDSDMSGDRVNAYIDFNADGEVAYNFTVSLAGSVQDGTITNENQFSTDWDGDWQHAAFEGEDFWSAEMLLPWTVAAMKNSGTPRRTVAVMFDRVLGAQAERSGYPAATFRRPRYVSEFVRIEIDQYEQSLFRVFPYATAAADLKNDRQTFNAGADLYWKPSGDFQLTAALAPDFGQVEADELVVNFDAIETFFSDRRPFFTENQGLFDLRTPDSGLLIYTRRIGGPRDDGSGLANEIDAAVKANGSALGFDYGALVAQESDYADDLGSLFYGQRVLRTGEQLSVGYLGTLVDRPFLDRQATVHAIDATWRANDRWQVTGQVLASDIDDERDSRGTGIWTRIDYTPRPSFRQEWEITHFDRELNFNDMGFQRRASLNEIEWTAEYQQTLDHQLLRGATWRGEWQWRTNDRGERIPGAFIFDRDWQYRSGASISLNAFLETRGVNDLITRGNGNVAMPFRQSYRLEYSSPRLKRWQFELNLRPFEEGLGGRALEIGGEATYTASEQLSLDGYIFATDSSDWLVWQRGNLLGRFERRMVDSALNINWFPRPKHELRVKLQWLAIAAENARSVRVDRLGAAMPSDDRIDDFSVNNFGLQLRYRYEFAPQSDIFAVYGRGGFVETDRREDFDDLLSDALSLRDADQFLVKVRRRF